MNANAYTKAFIKGTNLGLRECQYILYYFWLQINANF